MASFGPEARLAHVRPPAEGPCLDRFGALVSIVVLMTAASAAFVVRQNLDNHLFRIASSTGASATTGAAVAK